jgi:hypothetical protein
LHFYDAKQRFGHVFENGSDGVVFVGMLARTRKALCRTPTARKHVTRILLARDPNNAEALEARMSLDA